MSADGPRPTSASMSVAETEPSSPTGSGGRSTPCAKALGGAEVPTTPALCFIRAAWKLFAKPFQHNGVWVICSKNSPR
jgi:hypothetical protein